MTPTKPRIDRIAFIGWRGIEGCEVLDLDSGPLTGLVGPSGAGKSTLIMCLGYALLPDRKALDIRPISEVKDAQKAGTDTLAESVDPRYGFAYVILDITTRTGSRLIAGICVEPADGSAELTRWLIRDPRGFDLNSIMAQEDGNDEVFHAYPEFKRHCASRGIDVSARLKVGEYCQALYEAGILPSGMSMGHDRSLYASLIETTFKGGVSNSVVSRLKDYLLPEATQVSDIVMGLQECTNEVIMTRNEVVSAEKELSLLQSTYGVGKEVVLHSLRWMMESNNRLAESLGKDQAEIANMNVTLEQLSEDVPRINKEIELAEETKKNVLQAAWNEWREADDKSKSLANTLFTLKPALATAKANKSTFDQGRKQWQAIAGQHANQTVEWVRNWLESHRKGAEQKAFGVASQMEKHQKDSNRLNSGMASALSEKLAENTGGQTLEDAFSAVSEKEALAIELSLCGLTDGVVGVELDDLVKLAASDDLPDTFWLGANAPEPEADTLREVGDWYIDFAARGYVVTKKDRTPVFGSAARAARQKAILLEIEGLRTKHTELTLEAERLDTQKTLLATHAEKIAYYLAERDNASGIENAVADADDALTIREGEIAASEKARLEIEGNIQEREKPHEDQLTRLRADLVVKKQKLATLGEDKNKLGERITANEKALAALQDEESSARTILGSDFPLMFKAAENLVCFDEGRLPVEQTKRISALGVALQDEVPGRLAILQDIDPGNRLTTLTLWPILMEIVRERVSIDRAEINGEDLIQAMKEHRATLGSKLVGHENDMRIRARSLHQTIGSQAALQKRKIDKLSRLGEDITFGNVIGVRIVLSARDEMLSVLEGFTEQLFSENKPVDAALKEWFDVASGSEGGISLTGEELLDYRNYVDLSIEARRKGADWGPAVSLSGGESIGSGLALALMLARSIAARGEIKVDQIFPLFAVDEAHRLDAAGHAVVVDFAKREGFQVIVAAPELSPSYSCLLYALSRVQDPYDRLIIRGMRVTA